MDEEQLLRRIKRAKGAKALDLSSMGITALPPEVAQLGSLVFLSLSTNQLTALPPEIGQLSALERLYLKGNQLTALPPEIGQLTSLRRLGLSGNQLTALPPEIGQLRRLENLLLTGNQLTALPPETGQLRRLEYLLLTGNQLTALPPEIGQLTSLTALDLAWNQLTALPPEVGQPRRLEYLLLTGNQLTALPPEIACLRSLAWLSLARNQLAALPPEIGQLGSLEYLSLSENQFTALPAEIGQLEKLEELYVDGNPLTDPPPEVVEQGTAAVLAYLRGRLKETRRQWVSKLLAVGEGGVGKTCMLAALHGEPFDPQCETTHGIEVRPLELPHPDQQGVTMTLNCWDFGGQQIYHATHQFFLTNRSLFVLVWNARLGFEQGKLYYWLDTIKALAPDSPVVLVAAHIDERAAALPFEDLKRRYPQIADHCQISNKDRRGIKQLAAALAVAAADLPLMGERWPATWLNAAQAIRARPDRRISASELSGIMAKHDVDAKSQEVLGRWLHELGDILYFKDDEELKDTVLLNPRWVTENVSRVLECEEIIDGLGIFRREHMRQVWKHLEEGLHDRFLRLMERFDLSYRIPDDPENRSLVVERLSLDPPDYRETWDAILRTPACRQISMKFDLQIPRPAGIPTWFIARSHRFTTHTHWRYGALLSDGPQRRHLALVVARPSDEYVTLTVRGPSPYSFFALLKDGLELTLRRFSGLEIIRRIPCPGHEGQPCPHEFDYADLERAVQRERPVMEIQCPKRFDNVSVPKLLFGIHWSTEGAVLDRIEELERASAKRHEQAMEELKALRELTQREFTNLFNHDQRLAESHCPCVFTLRPVGRQRWPGLDKLLGQKWELQLYCEAPGCWHPTAEGGRYTINQPAKWLNTVAPHVQRLIKVFKFVAPLAGPWVAYAAPQYEALLKNDINLMKALVDKLPQVRANRELLDEGLLRGKGGLSAGEGASLRGLRLLLDELDRSQHWGGLEKVLTPEGHYLWLCEYHAREYER